jgi:hypothetical protein
MAEAALDNPRAAGRMSGLPISSPFQTCLIERPSTPRRACRNRLHGALSRSRGVSATGHGDRMPPSGLRGHGRRRRRRQPK